VAGGCESYKNNGLFLTGVAVTSSS
jgi:hypothetical protein